MIVEFNEARQIRLIQQLIGDDDWIVGHNLLLLKDFHDDRGGTPAEWESRLKTSFGMSKSRAAQLIEIYLRHNNEPR
jgi:hypothetical protein